MMGFRVGCFVLTVTLFAAGAGWLAAIPAVGALVIPYFAVVFANGGREPTSTRGFRAYEPNLPERYSPPRGGGPRRPPRPPPPARGPRKKQKGDAPLPALFSLRRTAPAGGGYARRLYRGLMHLGRFRSSIQTGALVPRRSTCRRSGPPSERR